jgi:S1-C subfamily serine protease
MGEGGAGNIGIGFAMPISRAKMMLDEYRAHGRIVIPSLGVQSFFIAGELADALDLPSTGGLLIQRVETGSSAQDAGLHGATKSVIVGNYRLGIGGDLIVSVDGKPVESQDVLARAMTRKRVGDILELEIIRGGKKQKITVKLGESSAVL